MQEAEWAQHQESVLNSQASVSVNSDVDFEMTNIDRLFLHKSVVGALHEFSKTDLTKGIDLSKKEQFYNDTIKNDMADGPTEIQNHELEKANAIIMR